jgi:adenine-specific DNA-methyltransferase
MSALRLDTVLARKGRGAFFTPPAIAEFLARFAIRTPDARVLDPTCGEAVFLLAAADRLKALKANLGEIEGQLTGVDLHGPSLCASSELLAEAGYAVRLVESDFFAVDTPAQINDQLGWYDAVIGNPPFIRYQEFSGATRLRALEAARAQGVKLSNMASSWAHTLVHATAFLKPGGRLAMVLPAELLTVQYAAPVRKFLLDRFGAVNLFMFERLQFRDAEEQVVLLVAHGEGPGESFCVVRVEDAEDLAGIHPGDPVGRDTSTETKWTHLTLTPEEARLYRKVKAMMTPLGSYGAPELGGDAESLNTVYGSKAGPTAFGP